MPLVLVIFFFLIFTVTVAFWMLVVNLGLLSLLLVSFVALVSTSDPSSTTDTIGKFFKKIN